MGLFDFLKKKPGSRPNDNDLFQFCYRVAYFMFPALLFSNPQKTRDIFVEYGDGAGAFFYVLLCKQEKIEPVVEHAKMFEPVAEHAKMFHAYTGELREDVNYLLLEYPTPPPVNEDLMKATLAPYFSVILYFENPQKVAYYILGQRPFGGTTLRTVTKEGANANLGEGCAPDRETFLAFLKEKTGTRE